MDPQRRDIAWRKLDAAATIVGPLRRRPHHRHRRHDGFAAKNRLPAICPNRGFVGLDILDLFRRSAGLLVFLKGAKPADFPIRTASKFEFVINVRLPRGSALPRLPWKLKQ